MPQVCRFYQSGSCKFGDNCKFDHPGATRSQSQNRFSTFGGGKNTGLSGSSLPYSLSKDTIEKDLTTDAPTWILSCYGPGRDAPEQLFGGYPREQSTDEIRLHYMKGAEAGKQQEVLQEINQLYETARQQMQSAVSNLDNAVQFVADGAKKSGNRLEVVAMTNPAGRTPGEFANGKRTIGSSSTSSDPFRGGSTGGGGFGSASAAAPASSDFGQPSAMGQRANAFGTSSGFGQPSQPTASAFGSAKPASAFGSSATTSAFGQTSQPASGFGQPSQAGGATFGQTSAPGGASAFGQPSALGQKSSPFGAQPAFGQTSQPTGGSAFGQPSQLGGGAGGASAFGQPSALGQKASPFSAAPAAPGAGSGFSAFANANASAPKASPFSQAAQSQPAGGAFGQPAQSSPFGQSAQPATTSPFGAAPSQPAASSPFGAAAGQPVASNPFGAAQPAAQAAANPFAKQDMPMGSGMNAQPTAGGGFGTQPQQPQQQQQQQQAAPNPFGQPTPSAFANAATAAPSGDAGNPYPPDSGRQHPPVESYAVQSMGRLSSWKGRPVSYKGDMAGYVSASGKWARIFFPSGPPGYYAETEVGADKMRPEDRAAWDGFQGRFGDSVPEVPPLRIHCRWDI